jgi:hypothetical protein
VTQGDKRWSVRTSSSGTWYLSQPVGLDGQECLGLFFADGTGELLLGIHPTWLAKTGTPCPHGFVEIGNRFWGWPVRILGDPEMDSLKVAETYERQRDLLTEILLSSMKLIEEQQRRATANSSP